MKGDLENNEEMMDALKEVKERYDALFSRQMEAVYICDFEGNFIDANPAALDMLGYSRDEITSLDFESLLTSDQLPKAFETVREIIETGSQKELIEYSLKHKDGHYIDVETKGSLIYKEGKPHAIQGTARDITKRKKAEAEVNLQSSLLNQSSEFIISMDLNGNINYANLAIANAMGTDPSDILGQTIDLFPDDQTEISNMEVLKNTLNEGHWEGERVLKIKYGSEMIIGLRTQLIRDSKGEPSGIFAIGRDITGKKKAEEALQESEKRYRSFVENFHGIAFRGDMNFVPIFFHGSVVEITGYTPEEFMAGNPRWAEIIHPDDLEFVMKKVSEVTSQPGIPANAEHRIIRKDGGIRWISQSAKVVFNEKKEPVFVEGVVYDVTERKKAEEELKESQIFNETLLNASSDVIYVYDIIERTNVYSNEGIMKVIGYSAKQIKDMGDQLIQKLMHPDDFQTYLKETVPRYQTAKDDELIEHEYRMKHKNGKWHWLQSIESIFLRNADGSPKQIFGIIRDITEQRKAQETLKESERMLKEAQRVGHMGSWSWSIKEDKVIWSDELYKIVDLDPNKPPPTYAEHPSLYTKESWPKLNQAVEKAVNEGKSYDMELDMVRSGGEIRHTHTKGNAIKDESGNVIGLFGTVQDITERIKSEEALRESENRYKTVSDLITDWAWSLSLEADGTTRWEWVSDSMKRVTGYSSDDIPLIEGWFSLIHPDDVAAVEKNFANTLSTRQDGDIEYRIKRSDGEYIWIHVFSHAIWDEHEKRVVRLVGATKDITEKKKAEEALRESETRSKIAQENANIGIWDWRLSDGHLVWSDVTYRLFGLEPGEETPSYELFESFVDPEDWKMVDAKVKSAVENDTPYSAEMRVTKKDGGQGILFAEGSVLKDSGGNKKRLLGTIIDITDRKQAENALRESEEKYRVLAEDSPTGIFISDPEKFHYVNNRLCEITGYSSEELINMKDPIIHLFASHEHERVTENAIRNFQGSNPLPPLEAKGIRRNGEEYTLKLTPSLIELDGKKVMQGNIEDITESKKAEQALRESQERLLKAQHIAHLGFWEWDLKTSELYWSDEAYHIYGLDAEKCTIGPSSRWIIGLYFPQI
jgi:PAS domain S-box-containing protein